TLSDRRRNFDEINQFDEEPASFLFSSNRSHQVVEVRNRMPSHETIDGVLFATIKKESRRFGMRRAVQRHVEEDVGVEQNDHQRYFFARRLYRSSLRLASLNLPRHRFEKVPSVVDVLTSRKASSMTLESDVRLLRAYSFAFGMIFSSIVTVNLVFTSRVYSRF